MAVFDRRRSKYAETQLVKNAVGEPGCVFAALARKPAKMISLFEILWYNVDR